MTLHEETESKTAYVDNAQRGMVMTLMHGGRHGQAHVCAAPSHDQHAERVEAPDPHLAPKCLIRYRPTPAPMSLDHASNGRPLLANELGLIVHLHLGRVERLHPTEGYVDVLLRSARLPHRMASNRVRETTK